MRFTTLNGCLKPCAWVVFFLCGFVVNTKVATADPVLTLGEAIAQTLEKNPQLYQYRFTEAALSAQRQASALRPAIALSLDVENFAGSGDTQGLSAAETTVALSSVIEMGNKRQARLSLADARLNRASWEQQAATLDVLGELTASFIEGMAAQANILLAQESLSLAQTVLATARERSALGATSEAEVLRAQAAVVRAEVRFDYLIEALERQKVLLARFWGDTKPSFSQFEGSLFEFGFSDSFDQLYARVQNSPAIQVFASEARIKDAEVTLARANGRSDLAWSLGIRRIEEVDDTAFTAGLSIPLFSNNRNKAEVQSALVSRNAVDYAQEDMLLRLRARLFEAYSLRNQSIAAIEKTQAIAIPALEDALQLTQRAYEEGRYGYLDLIAAQEELLATKQALIDTATSALISQAFIERLSSEALSD